MSTFAIWLIGYVIFVAGVVWGASLLGVQGTWLWVLLLVLVGLGIIMGVSRTRRPDPSGEERPG